MGIVSRIREFMARRRGRRLADEIAKNHVAHLNQEWVRLREMLLASGRPPAEIRAAVIGWMGALHRQERTYWAPLTLPEEVFQTQWEVLARHFLSRFENEVCGSQHGHDPSAHMSDSDVDRMLADMPTFATTFTASLVSAKEEALDQGVAALRNADPSIGLDFSDLSDPELRQFLRELWEDRHSTEHRRDTPG